jgi:signal peptidase II
LGESDGRSGEPDQASGVPAAWALPVVAVGVYLLDQATKHWALQNLQDEPIDIIGSLRLNLAFNTGAAFSGGAGYGPLIAVVVTVVVVVLILRRRQVIESAVGTVAVGMIAGGAIGNLSDRLFRAGEGLLGGAVVDFVDLQWWPIFNVADAAVILGGLMLVVDSVRVQRAAPTDPAEP